MNKKYAELDFPAWFDGKDINEAAFCREFLSKNKLIYADNAFFTLDGLLTDPLLLTIHRRRSRLSGCAFSPTYFTRRTFPPFRNISAIASFPAPRGSA